MSDQPSALALVGAYAMSSDRSTREAARERLDDLLDEQAQP